MTMILEASIGCQTDTIAAVDVTMRKKLRECKVEVQRLLKVDRWE